MPMTDETLMRYCKAAFFFAAGVFFSIVSVQLASDRRDFIASSVVVSGRVVALDRGGHHPRIEFVTKEGERTSFYGHSFLGLEVGDQIPVRYKPSAPWHTATIDGFDSLWGSFVFVASMSIAAAMGAVLQTLAARKLTQHYANV